MNVPLIYLCIFSIFLSLTLLFYNKGYKGANLFLSGYLFFSSVFLLTQYVFLLSKSVFFSAILLAGFPSSCFLIGPFAYFYVRSILRDNVKLSKVDYLHFALYFMVFIGTIPFIFSSWEYKQLIAQKVIDNTFSKSEYNINFLIPKLFNQLIRPPHILFYCGLMFWEFIKNKNRFTFRNQGKGVKIWLFVFFIFYILVGISYSIVQVMYFINNAYFYENVLFYYLLVFIAVIYSILNIGLLQFPEILYGLPLPSNDTKITTIISQNDVLPVANEELISEEEAEKVIFNPLISEAYKKDIIRLIDKWIIEMKFLEVNATLLSMSEFIDIPVHHLSYYFNVILNIKYPDWRNNLRIEYTKKQIDSGSNKFLTLEALSLESGFSSQSTFIRTFKNVYGCTPSEYIKSKV